MQKCEFKNEYHGCYHIITICYYILHLFFFLFFAKKTMKYSHTPTYYLNINLPCSLILARPS